MHPVYGRVLILSRQGTTQWMTVRYDEQRQKAVLDRSTGNFSWRTRQAIDCHPHSELMDLD